MDVLDEDIDAGAAELEAELTGLLSGLRRVAVRLTGTTDPRNAEDIAVVERRLRGMRSRLPQQARREPAAAA